MSDEIVGILSSEVDLGQILSIVFVVFALCWLAYYALTQRFPVPSKGNGHCSGSGMEFGEFSNQLDIDFDPFNEDGGRLSELVMVMFQKTGCIREFDIPEETLRTFIERVRSSYHSSNPYHNWCAPEFNSTYICFF